MEDSLEELISRLTYDSKLEASEVLDVCEKLLYRIKELETDVKNLSDRLEKKA